MKTSLSRTLAAVVLAHAAAGAQPTAPGASRGALAPGAYALINVHVVPMTSSAVVSNAIIVVENGRIKEVGTGVRVPSGMRTVDGRGAFVIPGLADMHTHLYSDGEVPDSAAPAELGVMIANGVTAVRMMAGTPEQLRLRDQVRRGEVLGPQLWLAGPMVANRPDQNVRLVTSPDSARAAVRDIAAAGYDFIKVTFGITGATYDALADEARTRRIGVVGHVEPALGLTRAMQAGQQIEHLDSFFEEVLADSSPIKESVTQYGASRVRNWESLDYIDDRKVSALAERVARSRVWVGPTLEAFNRWFGTPFTDAELHALPDWQIIPPGMRAGYSAARTRHLALPISPERRAKYASTRNAIVKRIADAGGADRLLAGSDTPDFLMTYGFALHRELQGLVRAGLTPYQALATATRNPAEFLGAASEWGTIEAGKRADLVLVTGNPLADIRNTQRIERVIVGGKVIEQGELQEMIRKGAEAVTGVRNR